MRAASGHLRVHSLSLSSAGPTLSLELAPGQTLGVFGPAGSGKTRLLNVLAGRERAARGQVESAGPVVLSGAPPNPKRQTPQTLAKRFAGAQGTARASEVLAGLGLVERRQVPLSELTPATMAATSLIEPLVSRASVLILDGALDPLDPWIRRRAWSLLQGRLHSGAVAVVASHLPSLLPQFDFVVILRNLEPVFAGTYQDLEREFGVCELAIETTDHEGVRALAAPFEIRVIETHEHGLVLRAPEGQALAARLLTQGYGDVKAVVLKRPTPEELLEKAIGK